MNSAGTDSEGDVLSGAVAHGNNALWNYVALVVWLRVLRRLRGLFSIVPVVCGGVGSWKILTDATAGNVSFVGSFLSFMAGVIPIVYMATRIEDNIMNAARIAGRYRVVEVKFRDFVIRFKSLAQAERKELYGRALEDFLQIKSEAHTVPRWCYKKANRLIEAGDYNQIAIGVIPSDDRAS